MIIIPVLYHAVDLPSNTKMLKTDDQEYESVKEFKYLGTIITEGNDVTADTKHRIIMANETGCVK